MRQSISRTTKHLLIIFAVIAACVGVVAFKKYSDASREHLVQFKVEGVDTHSATVTYTSDSGAISQELVVLPWEYQFKAKTGTPIQIKAQNEGDNRFSGLLITISLDGIPVKQGKAIGAYAVAEAGGML